MKKGTAFLTGLGVGGAAMFLLDPERGRHRRRLVKERVTHTGESLRRTSQRVGGTITGVRESTRSMLKAGRYGDAALVARVGLSAARSVSHPRAIVIGADHGVVTLSGPILAGEVDEFIRAVSGIRGVNRVENRLEVHQTADVPALQGESERVA